MHLRAYQKKRHFDISPEPKGRQQKNVFIFVVQKHAASHLHYDFRLAINGVLKSWAVPKGPCLDPSVKRLAIEVEDHPLAYASFEGTIPKGQYGAGEVIVWDEGQYKTDDNLIRAYQQGSMTFTLLGHKLKGEWKLIRLKSASKKSEWLLIKAQDKYAKKLTDYDVITKKPNSVLSRKTIKASVPEKIPNPRKISHAKNLLPNHFKPELATLTTVIPENKKWIFEKKFDGYRILAFVNQGDVRLISRNQHDWTERFPTIVAALKKLKLSNTLFDGELVVLNRQKKSSFQLLQNYLNQDSLRADLHYFIFDLPYYKGNDLTDKPLFERKKILFHEISQQKLSPLHYSEDLKGSVEKLLESACKKSWEGIMAKEKFSTYQQIRTRDWLKLKCHLRQEFIIVGYTQALGSRKYFGSLILAYFDESHHLIYSGHVGTGFNQNSLKEIYRKLKIIEQAQSPLKKNPSFPSKRKVYWVKPKLVAEVEFAEWTEEGLLRHPSFQGLREDKSPKAIHQELPVEEDSIFSQLTHPDKLLYPVAKITKLDLACYYDKVAEHLLPYVKDRPLSLLRCPADDKCFFQKNWMKGMPGDLKKVKIKTKTETKEYISIQNRHALIEMAQLSVLEIHPWESTNKKLNYPDVLIFDLDPDIQMKWASVIDATLIVHQALESLGLESFAKLTGGKGIHIVVPLLPKRNFTQVKAFAKLFAEKLAECFPHIFTSNIRKKERSHKIFVDYLRNEKEATSIAAFSPRHDEKGSVAVPVSWKNLRSYKNSKAYSIQTIDLYFKDYPQTPWKNFFTLKQILLPVYLQALKKITF